MNDKCYYLLNLWKQLNLDQQQDVLYVSDGMQQKKQEDFLKRFIKNISFINSQTEPTPYRYPSDIPFDMLSLDLCE